MLRNRLIILGVVLAILVGICSYKTTKVIVDPNSVSSDNSDSIVSFDVPITYDQDIKADVLNEVKTAIYLFPADMISAFCKEGWKISVVKDLDFTGTDIAPDTENLMTVGLTNYIKKTIQVKPIEGADSFITLKTAHELCHYADIYYGSLSVSDDFMALYEKYKNDYVEYEFANIKVTDRTSKDIGYATSDNYEFYACSMKDYLMHADYLKENYPDIFAYYSEKIVF